MRLYPAVVQNKTRVPQVGEFIICSPPCLIISLPPPCAPIRRQDLLTQILLCGPSKSHGPAPPAAPRPLPGAPPVPEPAHPAGPEPGGILRRDNMCTAPSPNAPGGRRALFSAAAQPQTFPGQHGRSDQNAGARPRAAPTARLPQNKRAAMFMAPPPLPDVPVYAPAAPAATKSA